MMQMQWIDDLLDEARNIAKGVTRFQLKQYKPPLSRAIGTLPPAANTPPAQMSGGGFTPADGSVTTAKIADGAVTLDKLSFDPATQAELEAHIADDAAHPQYLLLSSVSLTPGANIVPRAGVAGKLATGWIPAILLDSMVSGTLPIANGGTGATTAVAAIAALGGVRNAGNVVSIQAGLELGRPTVGTAGRIYLATDTLRIYRDNGTIWQLIGSVQLSDQLGELSDTQHGARGGGSLHATATTGVAGFMSAADKAKLDAVGAGAQVTGVSATGPLASSGGSAPTISLQNQAANQVLAGPTAGVASAPTFRVLVAADLPVGTARLDQSQMFTGAQTIRHGSGYGTVLSVQSNAGDIQFIFSTDSDGTARFGTATNHNFALRVNNTDRVFFNASGAVLVGRSSGLTGAGDLDANGRVRGATFETATGNKWTFGGHTAGALAATGYVTVTVDGQVRRLLCG